MAKKRHTRKRRQKKQHRRTMKGGAFTQQEIQQLENYGFNENQIQTFTDLGVSINEIVQKVNTIMNQDNFSGNSDDVSEQVMIELVNEHMFENPNNESDAIPHAADDPHYLDMDMDDSFDSQGSLHMSDLDNSNISGYTSSPDDSIDLQDSLNMSPQNSLDMSSQGSLHMSDLDNSNISGYTTSESDNEFGGRRRRRSTKKRRGRKSRKTRKQRGGMCFGNGVGANSNDPNYSIYNTNMLKLFPYRSN